MTIIPRWILFTGFCLCFPVLESNQIPKILQSKKNVRLFWSDEESVSQTVLLGIGPYKKLPSVISHFFH
jgi:hypothetical protein